jgi:cytochrome c oxidase subunit 3
MLLGSETMFFTGLIGAYMVLRQASPVWPPPGLPRLPILVTWVNTAVLMASCWTMWRANLAVRSRKPKRLELTLTWTGILGSTFLLVQGSEWVRLVGHGLSVSSGVYGATFYALIGVHGLHVLAGAAWLLWVLARARSNRFSMENAVAVDLVGIYWYYVGGLWLILFALVYLI